PGGRCGRAGGVDPEHARQRAAGQADGPAEDPQGDAGRQVRADHRGGERGGRRRGSRVGRRKRVTPASGGREPPEHLLRGLTPPARRITRGGETMRWRLWGAAGAVLMALVGSGASAAGPASQLDQLLVAEKAGKKIKEAPTVDDLGFLRRVYLDIVGRIPTDREIQAFLALPAKDRRAKVIDDLMKREQFADRWAVFFSDMFRIRYNADGGAAFQAWVHRALETDKPYDVFCRELISASGKANVIPEV